MCQTHNHMDFWGQMKRVSPSIMPTWSHPTRSNAPRFWGSASTGK